MDIIHRNFFRLLRAAAFDRQEQMEPMSAWKWRQLMLLAEQQDMVPLLHRGIEATAGQFFMQMPAELRTQWAAKAAAARQRYGEAATSVAALIQTLADRQWRPILMGSWATTVLYDEPATRSVGQVTIYFPFTTQGRKADEWAAAQDGRSNATNEGTLHYQWQGLGVEHRQRLHTLMGKLSGKALQAIIEREWLEGGTSHVVIGGRRVETIAPTLAMLVLLLDVFQTALNQGLRLWPLVDVGMMLTKEGHHVDFVKLQTWMESLRFGKMAQLVTDALTLLLGFEADEVPLRSETKGDSHEATADQLAQELFSKASRRPSRYLRYSPGEGIASVVASITHSLGSVEE